MYFHHFIGEDFTTLHLHVRINKGTHPREGHERVMLDDIIGALEHGKTVEDFTDGILQALLHVDL